MIRYIILSKEKHQELQVCVLKNAKFVEVPDGLQPICSACENSAEYITFDWEGDKSYGMSCSQCKGTKSAVFSVDDAYSPETGLWDDTSCSEEVLEPTEL